MKNRYLIIVLLFASSFYACKKDAELSSPEVKLAIEGELVTGKVNEVMAFSASTKNGKGFSHEWKLDDKVVSNSYGYNFTPLLAGSYVLAYNAWNDAGSFTHKYTITVPVPVKGATPESSKFISTVFDYLPAPGQFINESLGKPEGAQKLIGNTNSMVSLGGFGGYIIFGFDHSITNQTGYDLAIYGNPLAPASPWSEAGIVMVSQDTNGNGKPDDVWYELAGSEYNDPATIKNYEITYTNPKSFANIPWKDNQGNSGTLDVNNFHRHNFYPEFAPDQNQLTFKGTLLKSTWVKNGSLFGNAAFLWGYTDSWSTGDDFATNRYNSFDLDWAVKADGTKVVLATVDFIKVYTAQNEKGNTLLGEISTEVRGAVDLSIK